MKTACITGVLIALTAGVSAQDCGWEWVNPAPPRVDIYRLKQEINAFVGVGAAGTIIRSSSGYDWELVDSGGDGSLFGVDWGAGTFVAVGEGRILRSPTGYDWTTVYENSDAVFLDVEFSASRFVAVGEGLDGHFLTSSEGWDWELVPVPWGAGADSITGADEGFYVAVGVEIWFSSDGFEWNYQGPVPASLNFNERSAPVKKTGMDLFELDRIDLAWTGSRLLWAGGAELWSRKSTIEWELAASIDGCYPWQSWLGVVAGPGWALASGIGGCPTPYLDPTVSLTISVDGGDTFRFPWQTELGGFPGLARFGSRWIAVGAYGDVLTSSNGAGWDCVNGNCTSLACADEFVDLTTDEDDWLAVGGVGLCDLTLKRRSGGTAATSNNGDQWEIYPLSGHRFRGVTHTGTEFLGVGDGWLARSDDGVEWTTEDAPDGAVLYSVSSAEGWTVAVGRNGALYASDDTYEWLKPFLYVTADLDRVVWAGDQFLVVGREGTIMRSTDALNWSDALSNATTDLKSATAGPDQHIIVGNGGVILGSGDGEIWTPRRSGTGAHLRDVTWGEGLFVAVGWVEMPDGSKPGVVLASADGRAWTRFSVPGVSLNRVRWTGDQWIAVGGDRTILRSGCIGTLIEPEEQHVQVPHGETVDVVVRLSEQVQTATEITVLSSQTLSLSAPRTVTVPAGSNEVTVPLTGEAVAADVVVTLTLPGHLGGGSATTLATVQPPQWTPRTPSGRVTP